MSARGPDAGPGAVTGFYPYSFMDATRIGYGRPLLDVAGLGLRVLALVAAFVWIDKRLPQRQPEIGLAPSCGPGRRAGHCRRVQPGG